MFLADIVSPMKKVFRTLLLSLMLLTAASTTSASAFTKCEEWSSLGPNDCFLDIGPYIGLLVKFVNHLDETTGEVVSDGVKSAMDYGGQLSTNIAGFLRESVVE